MEIEHVFIVWFSAMGFLMLMYIISVFWGQGKNYTNSKSKSVNLYDEESSKEKIKKDLKRKIEREEIMLEEMKIKKDELEQKIDTLKYQITDSYETENRNQTEIRKAEISLRQAVLKIEEKEEVIVWLKKELWEVEK